MKGPLPFLPAALRRVLRPTWPIWLGLALLAGAWFVRPSDAESAQDPGYMARQAVRVTDLDRPPQTPDDRPVLFTGTLKILERHNDAFGLGMDDILYAKRITEFYGWVEIPQGDLTRTHGVPLYPDQVRYSLQWSDKLPNSTGYVVRRGHENPTFSMMPGGETIAPDRMLLGRLEVLRPDRLTWLDPLQPLPPAALVARKQIAHDANYLYLYAQGKAAATPQAGDRRYRYLGLRLPESARRSHEITPVTILGTRRGAILQPFPLPDGQPLFAVHLGDADAFLADFPPPAFGLRIRRIAAFSGVVAGLLAWLFAGLRVLRHARRASKESV